MKQSAAIKRASRQAQLAMYELDRRGVEDLLEIYRQAAAEVRARISAAADGSGTVPQHHLQPLLRQLEDVITELGGKRDQLIAGAIDQAAAAGVRPFTAQGIVGAGGDAAVIDGAAAMRIHQQAVKFVRDFTQADGFALSDRLWRLDRGAKEALTRAVGQAVVRGWSAQRAAQELIYGGETVPDSLNRTLARAQAQAMGATGTDLMVNPTTGALYQAERVFRSEINRAHGEAFTAAGEGTPGFAGWRYLLSPRHPGPDICDLLSTQNLYGLGPGVYPTRELTPWPAHPNTLSFLEIVFEDEITAADRAGKETSLQALARLTPAQRAGALGVTKAEYFDQGLLRTGMIRSSLAAVQARLQRQGKL